MSSSRRAPLVALAESQHGVVSRAQLIRLGLPRATIDSKLARGELHRVFRAVHALGHRAVPEEGRWMAAVLTCDGQAVLSHHSAARLWGMRLPADVGLEVHVTTRDQVRSQPGLVVHRTRRLGRADVTCQRGVPVTAVPRTVIDEADLLAWVALRDLLDHGVRLDRGALRRAHARHPGRRGAASIRRLVGDDALVSRSRLERRVLRVCREYGLARPRCNERVLGRERDFVWPHERVVLEADSHTWHAPRGARENDHLRDTELVLHGWRVMRATWDQFTCEPGATAARLGALLALGGA